MRKAILLVLFAIFSHCTFAQTFESAIVTNPNHTDCTYKQLVRFYDENVSIVLSQETNGIYSYYLENGISTIREISLSAIDTVNDFCIAADKMVYFSGNNNTGAYIGRFSFDVFFQNTPIAFDFIPQFLRVHQLKVYADPDNENRTHVVGIGDLAQGGCGLLDLTDKLTYPNWEYNKIFRFTEELKSFDFDDKYLVTVGINNNAMVNMRMFYKGNPSVYINGALFNIPIGIRYTSDTLFLKHMYDGKYVTVSSTHFSGIDVYTYCQVYDVYNSFGITYAYDRIIYNPTKNLIRDIEYSKGDNELLILMSSGRFSDDTWKDYLVYAPMKQNLTLPTQVKGIFFGNYSPKHPYFQSVRMFQSYHYILAGVDPLNFNMFLFAKDKNQEISTSCNKYDYLQMDGSNIGITGNPINLPTYQTYTFNWQFYLNSNPIQENFNANCYSTY